MRQLYDKDLMRYILKKTKWSESVFAMVDWDLHEKGFGRLTQFQKLSIAKLIHNLANANCQNHLYYG